MLPIALLKVCLIGLAIPFAMGHPGEHEKYDARAALAKRAFREQARRGLESCTKRSGPRA